MAEKTVLICPMDWGLGHASRCIPVINAFRDAGCRVVAASSGAAADLIRKETGPVPVEVVPFPGFAVSYSRYWLLGGLLMRAPAFLYHVSREKKMLRSLVEKIRPDLIISDNRYGLVHDSVPSVLITHQLKPSLPLSFRMLEKPLSRQIRKWALAFDECWIPDCPDSPAAGGLTSGWEKLPGARFTGWLSRFPGKTGYAGISSPGRKYDSPEGDIKKRKDFRYEAMFLLSGPEPHRTLLEQKVARGCIESGMSALIARGLPGVPCKKEVRGNTEIVSYLPSAGLFDALGKSRLVVCRSGYSSVMDLLVAEKNAILIPTPGQPEQEYLGKWLAGRGWFRVVSQKDFDIRMIMERPKPGDPSFAGLRPVPGEDLLQKTVIEAVRRYT